MTVQNVPPEKRYAANGVSTSYTIPFLLIEAGDLDVFLNGVEITSGFTISGVGNPTSTITFTAPPLGDLYLVLSVPFQRLVDYQENGDFLSSTVNRDFDRIWQALKQLRLTTSRSPVLGVNDIDGQGFYRAKGNGLIGLASANKVLDAATNYQDVMTLVTEIMTTGQGPANNAFNVIYSDGNSVGAIFRDKMAIVVNSIAALRNVLKIQYTHAFVSGYEPGTAGGGHYEYDSTDTISDDNGGTIIVNPTDGGRWKLKFQQFVTVEQFGVLPIPGRNNSARLAVVCAYGYANKVPVRAGPGIFEYGTVWDLDYPGLDFSGAGYRQTYFKFTGTGRACDAVGDRPNNGAFSIGLTLEDFTIEGNENASDLIRLRINHSRFVNINTREASVINGCGFRIQGCVASSFSNIICSTGDALMSSRPQNGIVLEADPADGRRASCNTFLNPVIEGLMGDGIVLKAADQITMLGGTSENSDGSGISIFAGCQINTFIGLGQENRGYGDIIDAGVMNKFINCYGSKNVYVDNSSVMSKIDGGYFERIEIAGGASRPTVTGVKVKFFGGTGGLITNGNESLKVVDIYDQLAGAYIFPKAAGRTITIGATPFTYTNTSVRSEAITVTGTGISSLLLKRDGATVGSVPAPGTYWLQPGDALTATYTGAVSMLAMPGGVD